MLYRNKYLDSVCTSPKKIRRIWFHIPSSTAVRHLGFLTRRKSAAQGREHETDIICESSFPLIFARERPFGDMHCKDIDVREKSQRARWYDT